MLRGIEDGDPAVPGAAGPPAIGPDAGYTEDDLARDLGIDPRDRALPRAVSAYAAPSPAASGRKPSGPPASTPASTTHGPPPKATEAVWPHGIPLRRDGLSHRPGDKHSAGSRKAAPERMRQ